MGSSEIVGYFIWELSPKGPIYSKVAKQKYDMPQPETAKRQEALLLKKYDLTAVQFAQPVDLLKIFFPAPTSLRAWAEIAPPAEVNKLSSFTTIKAITEHTEKYNYRKARPADPPSETNIEYDTRSIGWFVDFENGMSWLIGMERPPAIWAKGAGVKISVELVAPPAVASPPPTDPPPIAAPAAAVAVKETA